MEYINRFIINPFTELTFVEVTTIVGTAVASEIVVAKVLNKIPIYKKMSNRYVDQILGGLISYVVIKKGTIMSLESATGRKVRAEMGKFYNSMKMSYDHAMGKPVGGVHLHPPQAQRTT